MIEYADVVVDLQSGDTGKGKVTNSLASKKDEYTHVVRYNGGHNAGHTIYKDGKKIVTHIIPCGILHGIKSIIGPGCVLEPQKFLKEVQELKDLGYDTTLIKIDKRVHIITDDHLTEDGKDTKIGTTRTGNGPAYRDKYGRLGLRAEDGGPALQPYLIDIYDEFHGNENCKILFEGAQGFKLDIDWGEYPYVTSSHCTVGAACLTGVPPTKIRNVYGIAKAYETYVGAKNFEGQDPRFKLNGGVKYEIYDIIREIGQEYGATTGRPRQINWIDFKELEKAIKINGVNKLIINKIDVLEHPKVKIFPAYGVTNSIGAKYFTSSEYFTYHIIKRFSPFVGEIIFSRSPENI
jgi:adenylosuccinate synthase